MFWVTEEYPPDSELSDDCHQSTINAVAYLLERLKYSLEESRLPYYFIPCINIIEQLPGQTRMELIEETGKILEDVSSFIPDNVFKVCELFSAITAFVKNGIHPKVQMLSAIAGIGIEQTLAKDDGFNHIRSQYIPVFLDIVDKFVSLGDMCMQARKKVDLVEIDLD